MVPAHSHGYNPFLIIYKQESLLLGGTRNANQTLPATFNPLEGKKQPIYRITRHFIQNPTSHYCQKKKLGQLQKKYYE